MQVEEIKQIVSEINNFVYSVIRAQQILAHIKQEVNTNLKQPFEQDYIYSDHFGRKPSEPQIHKINGVTIETRILHQTGVGLRDITGADLLYEISGVKFLIVQYKRPDNREAVLLDLPQLKNLIENCVLDCEGEPPERLIGWCGSWYNVIDESNSRYLPACEARIIFGSHKSKRKFSFDLGLSKDTFIELFASCRIGSPINYDEMLRFILLSLENSRIVFSVHQIDNLI